MATKARFVVPAAFAGLLALAGTANATVVINLFDNKALGGTGIVTPTTGVLHGVNTAPFIGSAYVDFGNFTGPSGNRRYNATTGITYDIAAPGLPAIDGDDGNATVSGIVFFSTTAGVKTTTSLPTITFQPSNNVSEQFTFTATDVTDTLNYTNGTTFINLLWHGTLTGTGPAAIGPEAASMSWTFTAASGGSYTGGGSISDPPIDSPEPATLAVLGMSLAGLAMARRSRA